MVNVIWRDREDDTVVMSQDQDSRSLLSGHSGQWLSLVYMQECRAAEVLGGFKPSPARAVPAAWGSLLMLLLLAFIFKWEFDLGPAFGFSQT